MKTSPITLVLAAGAALALGACAVAPTAPTVAVLPGFQKSAEQFRADSAICQQQAQDSLANDAQAANNQAVANAAIGTLVGAAVGALLGQGSYDPSAATGWGAGAGLLIGSSAGASNSQVASYTLQQRFDTIYVQCMYSRGHQVPGRFTYQRYAPTTAPGYQPPGSRPPSYPPPNYPPPNYPPPNYPPPNYPPPNYPPPN